MVQLFCRALLGLSVAAVAFGSPALAAGDPYKDALAATCPAKRLDWLNPGILVDGIDDWLKAQPAVRRAEIERRAKPALAKCEAGAGCVNAAYIAAIKAVGSSGSLAAAVCRMPYTCRSPFQC